MSDSSDGDRSGSRVDGRRARRVPSAGTEVDLVRDAESDTVTFVSTRPEDSDTTTAWITAETDLVVALAKRR